MPNYPYDPIDSMVGVETREKVNGNWVKIENDIKNIAGDVLAEVINGAKLNWKEPVDTFADLATTYPDAETGFTAMTRDTGKVYRFDGTDWLEIQDIDPTAINEVDSRLTSQLADKAPKKKTDVWVDVKVEYGAKGDGVTDDTSAIQAALNQTGNVFVPKGTYMINGVTKLRVWSNTNIFFANGAVFKVITNSSDSYRVLDLLASENVNIYNPTLIGERDTHTGTTGEYGHGIVLSTAKNINIYNPTLNNFWGDGMAVYGGENVYVENLKCDNNRRQGVSIIRCKNLTINGAIIKNTNGTAPQCGIDVEPNNTTDYIENLRLIDITTENNAQAGISLILEQLDSDVKPLTIHIENHVDVGSHYGFVVGRLAPTNAMTGEITNSNPKYYDNKSSAIYVTGYARENTPTMKIVDPVIINPNVLNVPSSFPQDGSGIVVFRPSTFPGTKKIGNIIIDRPIIKDTRATKQMVYGLYVKDQLNIGCENLFINDPIIEIELIKKTKLDEKVVITDKYKTFVLDSTSQYLKLDDRLTTRFTNTGAAVATQVNIASTFKADAVIEFVNVGSNGFLVVPPAGINILPLAPMAGKYIQTTQIGASISLRRINDNSYLINSIIGNWSVQT